MKRKITDLEKDNEVMFRIATYGIGKETCYGRVWKVHEPLRAVEMRGLFGHKDGRVLIPFEDMIAVYNLAGIDFMFDGVWGPVDILVDETGRNKTVDSMLEEKWEALADVPMDTDTEQIEEAWYRWPAGTRREDIWKWFDDAYTGGVAELLYGKGLARCAECGKAIQQGGWAFDEKEREPRCPECGAFLNLPEGW